MNQANTLGLSLCRQHHKSGPQQGCDTDTSCASVGIYGAKVTVYRWSLRREPVCSWQGWHLGLRRCDRWLSAYFTRCRAWPFPVLTRWNVHSKLLRHIWRLSKTLSAAEVLRCQGADRTPFQEVISINTKGSRWQFDHFPLSQTSQCKKYKNSGLLLFFYTVLHHCASPVREVWMFILECCPQVLFMLAGCHLYTSSCKPWTTDS